MLISSGSYRATVEQLETLFRIHGDMFKVDNGYGYGFLEGRPAVLSFCQVLDEYLDTPQFGNRDARIQLASIAAKSRRSAQLCLITMGAHYYIVQPSLTDLRKWRRGAKMQYQGADQTAAMRLRYISV